MWNTARHRLQAGTRAQGMTMEKYGFETWHDYAALAILAVMMMLSTGFLAYERRSRSSSGSGRSRPSAARNSGSLG